MVFAHLLIVEELSADLGVEVLDAGVELLFLFGHLLHLHAHLCDLAFDLGVFVAADPADGILLYLFDVVDALEHVGYVVDAAFLDFELLYCNVEVDGSVVAALYEIDEFFGED
jgi:hypothetical protein